MNNKTMIVGIDNGNGYCKGNLDGQLFVIPSVAAKKYNSGFDSKVKDGELKDTMENLLNQMDLSFSSPLVKDTVRRLFGDRALTSSFALEEYDVFSNISKADVDLSGVLSLGVIASKVLQEYFAGNGSLPKSSIKRHVNICLALPIGEYRKHHKAYREKYLNAGASHLVTFHNFEQPVMIELIFDKVYITNEGEAAQYGLIFGGEKFLDAVASQARDRFPNGELDAITGKDLVEAKNTMGIDIGEGTVNLPVFTNGKFNQDASHMIQQGYGSVLERALDVLKDEGYPYKSRKELSEFINSEPSFFTEKKWNHVNMVVSAEAEQFAYLVTNEVTKIFNRVGGFVEVIFVYGGGASAMESVLFDKLNDAIAGFGTDQLLPIVYLKGDFSRFLNEHGLYKIASKL